MELEKYFGSCWQIAHSLAGFDGGSDNARAMLNALTYEYKNPSRVYHTLWNMTAKLQLALTRECIGCLKNDVSDDLSCLMFAIMFYNVVYDPTQPTNDVKSAEMVTAYLLSMGASDEYVDRVAMLVRSATYNNQSVHQLTTNDHLFGVFFDIKLSSLDKDAYAYATYAIQIRKEYNFIPDADYARKRIMFLTAMLDRQTLYMTPLCSSLKAFVNMQRELTFMKEYDGSINLERLMSEELRKQ